MSEPILEQIAALIVARIKTVTKANGYNTDVADCLRPLRVGLAGVAVKDALVILYQDDPREDDEPAAHGFQQWQQPFGAACIVRPSEQSATPVDKTINAFRGDVEKAIMSDPQWEGLAVDTHIRAPVGFAEESGAYEGVLVVFDVQYRTLIADPYTRGD